MGLKGGPPAQEPTGDRETKRLAAGALFSGIMIFFLLLLSILVVVVVVANLLNYETRQKPNEPEMKKRKEVVFGSFSSCRGGSRSEVVLLGLGCILLVWKKEDEFTPTTRSSSFSRSEGERI
mmetsp:Transcript_18937/g.39205  ORF Transcript_18937/g.39205 Transcript_18937/m.39205 type:complete len:122 (-) Transcript_18937:15-380(-)